MKIVKVLIAVFFHICMFPKVLFLARKAGQKMGFAFKMHWKVFPILLREVLKNRPPAGETQPTNAKPTGAGEIKAIVTQASGPGENVFAFVRDIPEKERRVH